MIKLSGLDKLPRKRYVIRRMELSSKTFALLCATGSSGKTMLAQYIAACVSSGTSLFGAFPVSDGKVIHVDQEQSADQTQARYERLASGLNLSALEVERVTLAHRLDSSKLNPKAVEQELTSLFSGARLAIIDSLKAVSEADENSADIERVLKLLKRVAEITNCAVLLIHHKGKGKSDAKQSGRGHSSIYDSVDVQIDLDCKDGVFEMKCAKNRDGRFFSGLTYQLVDAGDYVPEQNCSARLRLHLLEGDVKPAVNDRRPQVLHLLNDKGPMNHGKLYEYVGGDRDKYNDLLDDLVSAGEIDEKREGRARVFRITPVGKRELAAA